MLNGKPDRTEKQTRCNRYRLTKCLDSMGVSSASEVTIDRATRCINSMSSTPKTVADYASLLRSFSRWLWHTERLSRRPPRDAAARSGAGDTEAAPVVTTEELLAIMAAAPVRPVV